MVQAALVRGRISVGSYQPRDRNTRTDTIDKTDLLLRLKATGNQTTLETRHEKYHPHLVPLPCPLLFPLYGLHAWRWCRCCDLRTGSSTRKVPSVRHVMNSIKTLKNKVQIKRRKFIPRQNSTPFFRPSVKFVKPSINNYIVGLVHKHIINEI